jgi:acyl dehydratase
MTRPGAEISVTADVIRRYARLTRDENPIHLDPVFASKTPMGGIIAHGTMSAALIWEALRSQIDRGALRGLRLSIRFRKPVRIGDTVRAWADAAPESPNQFAVRVVRDDGETVIEGTATTGPQRATNSGHAADPPNR